MSEEWRDVIGYEGLYQVSSYGRVMGWKKFTERDSILTPIGRTQPYFKVRLYRSNGDWASRPIHRLVAESFIPNPKRKPQVNHIDGNKKNNVISNLEWSTASENCKHRANVLGLGLRNNIRPVIGFNKDVVIEFKSMTDAANCGYVPSCVRASMLGKRDVYHGLKWKNA